ncbi:MAG: hypothetical protein R2757_00690 [Draconibacterium sp.]
MGTGYEIVNQRELDAAVLSKTNLRIILCKEGVLELARAEYYSLSIAIANRNYKNEILNLKKLLQSKDIKEKEYNERLEQLAEK